MSSAIEPALFQQAVFNWFDVHGRKHLPWQVNKIPYRVWLSEIMLQQTQVATVIGYYERFMQAFPTVYDLAEAPADQVMHLWAGLGYYSRARNLHAAAKKIVQGFNGHFPDDLPQLMSLPGVGRSTAGAIRSIAFNLPTTILDGNVKRVLARVYGVTAPINDRQVEADLWRMAESCLPSKRAADYTQAMMDLGATCCTPRQPRCAQCPLQAMCVAHAQQLTTTIPNKTKAKPLPTKSATFFIFRCGHEILLQKNPERGIWGGLWCLPQTPEAPKHVEMQTQYQQYFAGQLPAYEALPSFRHTFTHYHLILHPVLVPVRQRQRKKALSGTAQVWYNLQQPEPLGLPKPIKTIIEALS